jgi:hypothetical protein
MQKLNLGKSEVAVLRVMSDLERWSIAGLEAYLILPGARQAVQRLYARGFLDRALKQTRTFTRRGVRVASYHVYWLSCAGLEAVLS